MFEFGVTEKYRYKLVGPESEEVFTRTIDSLRETQSMMQPYRPIIFDELKPDDRDQNQYYSEDSSFYTLWLF